MPDFLEYALDKFTFRVINEKLVPAGRIPSESEVMTWVADALN